jgi:hypothetical protein
MQKVKVQRYISGKRPEYAQYDSSDEESEGDDFIDNRNKGFKDNKLFDGLERNRYVVSYFICAEKIIYSHN